MTRYRAADLVNTTTISSPVTDPDPGNNSATDADTALVPEADLVIVKDDGMGVAVQQLCNFRDVE